MTLIDKLLSSNVNLQKIGQHLKGPNDYLSFNKKTGEWQVRSLSTFQQKCRDSLGMYKNTHTNTVVTQLKREISQMQSPKLQELDNRLGHIPLVIKILPDAKTFEERLQILAEKLNLGENETSWVKKIGIFVAAELDAGVSEAEVKKIFLANEKLLKNVKTHLDSMPKNTLHVLKLDKIVNEVNFHFEIKNLEKQIINGKISDERLLDKFNDLLKSQNDKGLSGLSEEEIKKIFQEHPEVEKKMSNIKSSVKSKNELSEIDIDYEEINIKNNLNISDIDN